MSKYLQRLRYFEKAKFSWKLSELIFGATGGRVKFLSVV